MRAADWLTERADAQQSGWQKHETILTPASVKGLQLLWKYRLTTRGDTILGAPTILGRVITHRGIKELVFTADSDTLLAMDADLGTVFWERHLEGPRNCDAPIAAPVITPAPPPTGGVPYDDEGADPTQGNRPLYALSRDGKVHTISPITGQDIASPLAFLPAGLALRGVNFFENTLYAFTGGACDSAPGKTWAIDVKNRQKPAALSPVVAFSKKASASWNDPEGTRWIYVAADTGISAFRGGDVQTPIWKSELLNTPGSPVIAGGVVYTLARRGTHIVLYALDAATGQELYSSGEAVTAGADSGLAVANGHVCFGASNEILYCFGLPFEP